MLRSSIRGTTNATVSAMAPSKPTRMVATISRMTAFYLMGLGNSVNKRLRPRIGQVTDVRCEGVLANSPQSNETARIEDSAEGRKAKGRRAQAEGAAAQGVAQGSCAARQAERRARHLARRRGRVEPAKQALLRCDRTMLRRCARTVRAPPHRVPRPRQPPPSPRRSRLEPGIVVAWLVQPFVTTHPASLALRKRRGPSSGCPT